MKRISVKLKLTLWFTAFMALTAALCLCLILAVSSRVTSREASNILSLTVRANLTEASVTEGRLVLTEGFTFYSNDVYMLIYNKKKAILTGQAPPLFPVDTALENGKTKHVAVNGEDFYVLDFWIPSGWEDGIWLRGVMKRPDKNQMIDNIVTMFSIILPFFILSAAGGGYLIAKKAMEPISKITDAAGKISEGKDLTKRIGLSGGNDEVSRLSNAFDRMFERLEHSFEAEKQFTSDASHELRTPTAVILAQCSFVKKHGESLEEYQEAIDVIDRQAGRMSLLINRLLDLTRLDLGTQRVEAEQVNLSSLVRALCEEQDSQDRGISLSVHIQEGILIQADSFLISRVITNLLENARKYGKEGGFIRVVLSRTEGKAVLQVEDNGIGMEKEDLNKIWQRFYQVNASRNKEGGLGLGLSMVRQIVHLFGGSISVESVLGEGSYFTVEFKIL